MNKELHYSKIQYSHEAIAKAQGKNISATYINEHHCYLFLNEHFGGLEIHQEEIQLHRMCQPEKQNKVIGRYFQRICKKPQWQIEARCRKNLCEIILYGSFKGGKEVC